MKRRDVTAALLLLMPLSAALPGAAWAAISDAEAAGGVRAALERGALAAVSQLGRKDGFLGNPELRIPLPGALQDAARLLKFTGQQRKVDELVTGMNRAAEAAMPAARALIVKTVKQMSLEDALRLVRGAGPTAVTDYFAEKTREPLAAEFLPIVTLQTERLSLAKRYNAVAGQAVGFGLMKAEDANVQQYVTAKALDALYRLIGVEEQKIRADPLQTGSAILRKVFGR